MCREETAVERGHQLVPLVSSRAPYPMVNESDSRLSCGAPRRSSGEAPEELMPHRLTAFTEINISNRLS
jgi:hypothetical protein